MAIDVVRLTDSNSACLGRLAPDVFDNPIDPVQLARFLADPRHVMVVALHEDAVVGMASGVEYFHPDKPPQMWINEVGVSPAYRRQGIGRRLTTALVDIAENRGCDYAWLGTTHDTEGAERCFGSVPGVEPAQHFILFEWNLRAR